MPRGAAKSAELRRIAAGEEPLLFGSLYPKRLPSTDSTPADSQATSGTALERARSFIQSIRGWFK